MDSYPDLVGRRWSCLVDLGTTATRELVVPKPYVSEPAPIAGDGYVLRQQVVIMGMAWSFTAGGVGQGFVLNGISSLGTDQMWEELSNAAGHFHGAITPTAMPLQPTAADSPATDPATLSVTVTAATNGKLWVWGILNEQPGKRDLYQDSPQWSFQ